MKAPSDMNHSRLAAALIALSAAIELLPACNGEMAKLSRDRGIVKAEFERVCTGCHSLDPIMNKNRDFAGWLETVERMKVRGAKLEDWMLQDFPIYLAHVRGPKD